MSDDNKSPSHRAYSLINRGEDKDDFWHNVGSCWLHKDGKGMNCVLEVQPIPVDGKVTLVIREVNQPEPEKPAKSKSVKR